MGGQLIPRNEKIEINNKPNNPVPVEIVDDVAVGDLKSIYDESLSVAKNNEIQLVTYTVPTGKTFYLKEVEFSGDNRAKYWVRINTIRNGRQRTWDNHLNGRFNFYDMELVAGTFIELRMIHQRPQVGDFDGRIIGNEI